MKTKLVKQLKSTDEILQEKHQLLQIQIEYDNYLLSIWNDRHDFKVFYNTFKEFADSVKEDMYNEEVNQLQELRRAAAERKAKIAARKNRRNK